SAQQDVANSKDHVLLSRYDGSWINRYSLKEYEVYTYPLSREMVDYNKLKDNKSIEGQITAIEYVAPEGPEANVLVVGHTDNTGDFDLNMSLSQKRAASVVAALVKNFQIDSKQLTAVGVGMASPLASNRDEAGRVRNRRVELVIK